MKLVDKAERRLSGVLLMVPVTPKHWSYQSSRPLTNVGHILWFRTGKDVQNYSLFMIPGAFTQQVILAE